MNYVQIDFAASGCDSLCFEDPVEIVRADTVAQVVPALARVQEAVTAGLYAAGFVCYEAAPAFDAAMQTRPPRDLPLVWFGLYREPIRRARRVTPVDGSDAGAECTLDCVRLSQWTRSESEAEFTQSIGAIREHIAAGDLYQVNHTMRLRASFSGDAAAWYRRLRSAQQGRCAAYLDLGRYRVLSASPELFFAVQPLADSESRTAPTASGSGAARKIVTRPMKGTHPRGRWPAEDLDFQARLADSEKDRAENLMIVDLVRNDLGRIAELGSVRVERLFDIEPYPTLLQMTSTVTAQLRSECGLPEIMQALFPCGSVTGAPKIAAMARIAALEQDPRQIYCGTIGYLTPDGSAAFNVAIRTVLLDCERGVAEYGVGSGVTWGSDAAAEWSENLLKSAVLNARFEPPALFETLRLEEGCFTREDRHLARLMASAAHFAIPSSEEGLREALRQLVLSHPTGLWRARLRLSSEGGISAEAEPLEGPPDRARSFAVSANPVDRHDRRLFHKTVDRSLYAERRAERPDADEALLTNRQGELTEFTTGNLVVELEGALWTPPLECGLLPGVLREELLESGRIRSRVLRAADLARAERVWLINSLRGWVPMTERPTG